MNEAGQLPTGQESPSKGARPGLRTIFFILEIAFVAVLLLWWFASDSLQTSKNLWVLFLYCFPAEFLIAIVPHEPILLYFSKFSPALTVALVSMAGTVLTESLNYSVFKFAADMSLFKKIKESKLLKKSIALFDRSPFLALWLAGFTPIPFYPFRFLVVLARYPLAKYLLAVFLSRTPRFYLLALFGHAIKIPNALLMILFALLIAGANIPFLKKLLEFRRREKTERTPP